MSGEGWETWAGPPPGVDCYAYVFELEWLRLVSPGSVANLPLIAQAALKTQPVVAYFLAVSEERREQEEAFSSATVETAVSLAMRALNGRAARWIVLACPATVGRTLATLGPNVPVWGIGRA